MYSWLLIIVELHACLIMHEQSPIPKKMWFSIHPRNFWNHMTVCLPNHPSVLTTGEPTLNVNLLAGVGA